MVLPTDYSQVERLKISRKNLYGVLIGWWQELWIMEAASKKTDINYEYKIAMHEGMETVLSHITARFFDPKRFEKDLEIIRINIEKSIERGFKKE